MLQVTRLAKSYGEGEAAVHAIGDLSFTVEKGEFVCIVGPSGCGKTTLLKCMSGLLPPSDGEVRLRDELVDGPPEAMALVFQEYSRSLLPWMSVRSNVVFPLRRKGLDKAESKRLVEEAVASVGLLESIDRYPWELSGGMQQRVAIGRALAYQPELLLMDEPFASVDAQTRADLEDLVLKVREEFGVTIVFVTHDIDESVYMADRVIVLAQPPTHVLETIEIELPKPRDQLRTKAMSDFAEHRAHIYGLIKPGKARSSELGESTQPVDQVEAVQKGSGRAEQAAR